MVKAQSANKGEAARERMCIVTRARADDVDLVRFVLDPTGQIIPDIKANLPGRGAWVKLDRAVLAQAVKRKAFARAFKTETPIMGLDEVVVETEAVLRRHALGSFGFARKAGLVVNGFSKVESALKQSKAYLLLNAADAGADGAGKLVRLAGHMHVPVTQILTHDEMSLALGLEHVIHAALLDGPGAARFSAPIRRLESFCTGKDQQDGTLHRDQAPVLGDKTAV